MISEEKVKKRRSLQIPEAFLEWKLPAPFKRWGHAPGRCVGKPGACEQDCRWQGMQLRMKFSCFKPWQCPGSPIRSSDLQPWQPLSPVWHCIFQLAVCQAWASLTLHAQAPGFGFGLPKSSSLNIVLTHLPLGAGELELRSLRSAWGTWQNPVSTKKYKNQLDIVVHACSPKLLGGLERLKKYFTELHTLFEWVVWHVNYISVQTPWAWFRAGSQWQVGSRLLLPHWAVASVFRPLCRGHTGHNVPLKCHRGPSYLLRLPSHTAWHQFHHKWKNKTHISWQAHITHECCHSYF